MFVFSFLYKYHNFFENKNTKFIHLSTLKIYTKIYTWKHCAITIISWHLRYTYLQCEILATNLDCFIMLKISCFYSISKVYYIISSSTSWSCDQISLSQLWIYLINFINVIWQFRFDHYCYLEHILGLKKAEELNCESGRQPPIENS